MRQTEPKMHSRPGAVMDRINLRVRLAKIDIWVDGSCHEGWAGWAAVLVSNGRVREVRNGSDEPNMTNQRAEIMAAIEGLSWIKGTGHDVTVWSDLAYVVNCFQQDWISNWRRKGWCKSRNGEPVANRDLWETVESLVDVHDAKFKKVKGHSGVEYNERADVLAGCAREQHRRRAEVRALGKTRLTS
jgi:ribonuclease HI